jgi:hypothetical protein
LDYQVNDGIVKWKELPMPSILSNHRVPLFFLAGIAMVFPAFENFTLFYGALIPGRFSP